VDLKCDVMDRRRLSVPDLFVRNTTTNSCDDDINEREREKKSGTCLSSYIYYKKREQRRALVQDQFDLLTYNMKATKKRETQKADLSSVSMSVHVF